MPFPPKPLRPERSASDWFGAEVRYWRTLRRLTQRELGQRVWASDSTIRKIETNDRHCTEQLAAQLDEVLQTGGVLRRAWKLLDAEAKTTSPKSDKLPQREAVHGDKAQAQSILDDVERRAFLKSAGTGLAVTSLFAFSASLTDFSRPAQIHCSDIDQIRDAAQVFTSWDHSYGGTAIRGAVVGQLHWAAQLLEAPCPPSLRDRAFAAVAHLFMVGGFMAFDAYAHDDARRAFTFATDCAEEAGDWHLRAKIYSHRSRQAIWRGRPDDGLTYAELGLVRAERLSAPERAMLHTARARAYAKQGQRQATLAAVGDADDAFASESSVPAPRWMGYYDAAQHAGDTGHALWDLAVTDIHPARPAVDRLSAAVEGHDDAYARSRAISGVKLASLLMHQREVERGISAADRALDDMGRVRSRRAEDDLRELHDIAGHVAPERDVTELRERIATLVAAS